MKKIRIPLLASIAFLLSALVTGCYASTSGTQTTQASSWTTDYNAALAKAKESGKRVLIDFSGSDWCHWCIKMEEDTLSQQAFKDYAAKHLELVLVDTPMRKKLDGATAAQNDNLKRQFGVRGFPCFVVVDSSGHELDRREGYVQGGPDSFIAFLKVTEGSEKLSQ